MPTSVYIAFGLLFLAAFVSCGAATLAVYRRFGKRDALICLVTLIGGSVAIVGTVIGILGLVWWACA